jgi:hypothetical protein
MRLAAQLLPEPAAKMKSDVTFFHGAKSISLH